MPCCRRVFNPMLYLTINSVSVYPDIGDIDGKQVVVNKVFI